MRIKQKKKTILKSQNNDLNNNFNNDFLSHL